MPVLRAPGPPGGGSELPPGFGGPRRDWQFILGPAAGGWEIPLTQATGKTITWRLTDAHEAQFTVSGTAGLDAGIGPLATDLHVLYAGQCVFRGRVGGTVSDSWAAGYHTAQFSAYSYRALLRRRILYSTSRLVWTGTDVGDIVAGLLTQAVGRAGSALNVVTGAGFPYGATTTLTCTAGDIVADKIDALAYVAVGGFDWDITPRDQHQQTLDLWAGSRGTDRGMILQYGDHLTGDTWSRTLDTSQYANAARVTGGSYETTETVHTPTQEEVLDASGNPVLDASGNPTYHTVDEVTTETVTHQTNPVELETDDIATRPEGRWDAVYSTDEADQSRLDARAVLQLEASSQLVPSYVIPLRPGAWEGPQQLWIGDPVTIITGTGRFRHVTETLRVLELKADIGEDATAVTLTCGQPRWDQRAQLARLAAELRGARLYRVAGRNPRPRYVVTEAENPPEDTGTS